MNKIKTEEEARAFARFLLYEHKRHREDMMEIEKKLKILSKKWELIIDYNNYALDNEKLTKSIMWVSKEDI